MGAEEKGECVERNRLQKKKMGKKNVNSLMQDL